MNQKLFKKQMNSKTFKFLSCEAREDYLEEYVENVNEQEALIVAMEECAELQQVISKWLRGDLDKMHLLEELADVELCCKSISAMAGFSPLEKIKAYDIKAKRIHKKIETMYKTPGAELDHFSRIEPQE